MTDTANSGGGLFSRLPEGVKIGLALISIVYGVAILTGTIEDPIPSGVWAVVWISVGIYLIVRAVRLSSQS
ncbi:hypothetical protein [Halorubrum tibetense]|uniref:Uncharacterized protein n=1 Tax=Halorubrum tibetense TaxID=175631 RepID=A0ABD5S9C9_9EURY